MKAEYGNKSVKKNISKPPLKSFNGQQKWVYVEEKEEIILENLK